MKKIILFFMVLLCISIAIASTTIDVNFKGKWGEGKTLYTSWYRINNATIYGKDVFPVRTENMNKREKVCETIYKEKKKRVCHREEINGRNRRVCEIITYQKPYTKCRYIWVTPITIIGCKNKNGVYTNSLLLSNFMYSTDGIEWLDIPYGGLDITPETGKVRFRLEIPSICSPEYHYNDAITLVKYN